MTQPTSGCALHPNFNSNCFECQVRVTIETDARQFGPLPRADAFKPLPKASARRRVVVVSPYRGVDAATTLRNVVYLRRCLRDALLRGEAPFASHGLYTQPGVLNDAAAAAAAERELGMAAGLAWQDGAEAIVVYTDYGMSSGMESDIAHAATRGLLVESRQIGTNAGSHLAGTYDAVLHDVKVATDAVERVVAEAVAAFVNAMAGAPATLEPHHVVTSADDLNMFALSLAGQVAVLALGCETARSELDGLEMRVRKNAEPDVASPAGEGEPVR